MNIKALAELIAKVGGGVAAVATVASGAWFVMERLEHAEVAYAQSFELKDDVKDIEKRYNAHVESEWKKLKVDEAKRERRKASKTTTTTVPPR